MKPQDTSPFPTDVCEKCGKTYGDHINHPLSYCSFDLLSNARFTPKKPAQEETVKHTAPTPNWICESCGAENLPTVTCCQVCKEWKVEEMVKQFEQYLSPLVRCGYTHAIIQLREWLASLPAGEISLDVQLDKMEKEKQQVDKALLSKELEAYQKNRALAQEEIANLKLENEKLKFFIENESRRLVESVAERDKLIDLLSKAEKILFRVEFAGDPVNESDFYKEVVAALGVDSKQQQETVKHTADSMNESARLLGELLAVMHGDGGHYQEKHGEKKAVEDALTKYYNRITELDELRAEKERLTVGVQAVIKKIAAQREYNGDLYDRWSDELRAALGVDSKQQ